MKRFIKYGVIPVVTFLFLLIATVIVLPVVINVSKYLPEIEDKLSNATGRPISIGSNFGLSFFPWLSISFSDLKIDNPKGFLSDGFIKIESFEARIKLLPLLNKEVEISRFIIGGLEVNLERNSEGEVNWDLARENRAGENIATPFASMADWSVPEDFFIALFVVTDGTVTWADRTKSSRHRVDDLMLVLNNVTLNEPVMVDFKASLEGKTLAAEGKLGPLGKNPGRGVLPVDLAVSLVNTIKGQVKGKFINLLGNASYDIDLHVPPFSAREFFASMNNNFPFVTNDITTFRSVAIDITAKGDKEKVSIENGKIKVDDTLVAISLVVKKIKYLDLGFVLDIGRLDLDRYLAPEAEKNNEQDILIQSGQGVKHSRLLSEITLEGAIKIKELIVGGGLVNDIDFHLRGADGIFEVDPASFVLYQGRAESNVIVDFQSEIPQTSIELKMQGVQARPLLHDFMTKDFLSGTVDSDIRLLFSGNSGDAIRTSLYADGTLIFKDGAVEGIDMVSAIKNIADSSPDSDSSALEIRTDFSELMSVFTIRKGLVNSSKTTLKSPFARVLLSGSADLVSEQFELMIEPQVAAVMTEEQGHEEDSSGGAIPFTLSGAFANPKIIIDAEYLPSDEIELPHELNMQSLVDEKLPSPVDEDVRDLVGTTLIDPAVVAKRFGLQSEVIRKGQIKKQLKVGSGRIRVRPFQEEDSWH